MLIDELKVGDEVAMMFTISVVYYKTGDIGNANDITHWQPLPQAPEE